MSFYDELSKKFLSEKSLVPRKMTGLDFILNDYIEMDGQMISIYKDSVKLSDIVAFFKERMPWVKIILKDQLISSIEPNTQEYAMAKSTLYGQLIDMLEETHKSFSDAFVRRNLSERFFDDQEYN